MVIPERDNLIAVKTLINNSSIRLVLFENREGNLFLSSNCSYPEGTVYYATVPSLLLMFLEGQINLQTLFDNSPSVFVEISNDKDTALYHRKNAEVKINSGDKTVKDLTTHCNIEIW